MSKVATAAPVPLLIPARTFVNDLRAIKIVWHRDIIRFSDDKARGFASLGQPILHLFVMGTGMSSMMRHDHDISLRTFLFPGVLSISVLFTCFLSAGSMVMDREFGFMRVMLAAPVRRGSIVLAKCLSGCTIGAIQGSVVVALGGFVGVPYDPTLMVTLVGELVLLSFAVTSFGVLVAVHTKRMHSFLAIMQLSLTPMYFLSGALFPVNGLPRWLSIMTRLDPLSYAVDPMRRAVFGRLGVPVAGITWAGAPVPVVVELGLLAALSLIALRLATLHFQKTE